jgi:hypothetical protein
MTEQEIRLDEIMARNAEKGALIARSALTLTTPDHDGPG